MYKILIIDDDPLFSDITSTALKDAGNYEVMTENRTDDAMKTICEFMPDLILLDVMMPGMLGSEIAEQVINDPALRHIKVVFLTGMIKKAEERKRDANGPLGPRIIAKPVDRNTLIEIIHQELSI